MLTPSAAGGDWTYGYDGNGYLASGTRSDGVSFTYAFDEAGRPTSGVTDYRPTVRVNGSTIQVMGSVAPAATVTINGTSVTVSGTTGRFSQTYSPTLNTWQSYTVRGTLSGSGHGGTDAIAEEVRDIFVPPASETLGYDASGNRTGDARWNYHWNALDQMTSAYEKNPAPGDSPTFIDCTYDCEGRRVEKKIRHGNDLVKRTLTVWDGWKPVLDIDYSAGSEVARRYYTWGPDVSGSLDGAAGIGGLVEIAELKNHVVTRCQPIYDGLGNITGLINNDTGARVAWYEYGPFGEVLSVCGERASTCPFRFQTKRYDEETGQYYFGKRYYDPKTRTWLSRDPLREGGGVNLYAYCGNDPVGSFDSVGLLTASERQELELENTHLSGLISQFGWRPDSPEEVYQKKLKTHFGGDYGWSFALPVPLLGDYHPGGFPWVKYFDVGIDNKAQLRNQYSWWESDEDIALREAVRSNRTKYQTILANNGLLDKKGRQALAIKLHGALFEATTLWVSIPFGLPAAPEFELAAVPSSGVAIAEDTIVEGGLKPFEVKLAIEDYVRGMQSPASKTAINASYDARGYISVATNGDIPEQVSLSLGARASKIGGIGNPGANTSNILGRCAEFRSTNELMNNFGTESQNVFRSLTYRPRNLNIVVPPCPNCQTMFFSEP